MKTPKYNIIDFKEAKESLSKLNKFYKIANSRLHWNIDQDAINDITRSIDCAIAALDVCINNCVFIEIEEHHTFAVPNDVSAIDFPGTSREDK